jgi:hypothetical protein
LLFLLQTPAGHSDIGLIDEALNMLDRIIRMVDIRTGEAKCEFIKEKLRYMDDSQVKNNSIICNQHQ